MEPVEFSVDITPKALAHIKTLLEAKLLNDKGALVITDKRVIGSGYEIIVLSSNLVQGWGHYICLFEKNYHHHGFPIYVDKQLISERYLPTKFGIDSLTNSKGKIILDIKNPDFEKY